MTTKPKVPICGASSRTVCVKPPGHEAPCSYSDADVENRALRAALAEKQDALVVSDTRWMEARAEIQFLQKEVQRARAQLLVLAQNNERLRASAGDELTKNMPDSTQTSQRRTAIVED